MPKLCIATMFAEYMTRHKTYFLKMSPNLSWNSSIGGAAYDTLMAAMVVAGTES